MIKLWDLFQGYGKAHGRFEIKRTSEKGKSEGRALTIKEPTNQAHWERHVAGDGAGLGIIPLLEDDTILWGCIDIDANTIDHSALEKKINHLKLPLVVARSKSGGAHCYVFFSEPVPAKLARLSMESWAAALGHGGCEVFPKQVMRFNADDLGNWLNMPYYFAEKTLRYGIKDGKALSLEEFEIYAESKRISPDELEPSKEINGSLFTDGPPCLQHLHGTGGFAEGTRNDGMYNVAVYLRKKFPDDWQDHIQEYNVKMCSPPLSLSELNALVKSVGRKSYAYRCKQSPIAQHCHRNLCLTRACGVGETAEGGNHPEIGNLTKHLGDPVLWFLDLAGQRIMLTTDELLNQNLFKRKVVDAINRVPATIPTPRWNKFIDDKLRNCDIVEVPMDASPTGQFQLLVEQYATGQAQATSKEELIHRMTPFRTGTGKVWFRSRGLLDYLSNHGFKFKSEHHVWQMLRDMGAKSQFLNVKGHGFNIWEIPEPKSTDEDAPLPEFGTKEF